MKIVGPRLGPILPWVGARVSADESLLPIDRGAVFIVILQCLLVVSLLVAENLSESDEPVTVPDQSIPVIMADFVPKMTQQRTVRLAHGQSPLFAFRVIRFG